MARYQVQIQDGPHAYSSDSPSKDTVTDFLTWWMTGVRGKADVSIHFIQDEPPAQQVPLDQLAHDGAYDMPPGH